MEQNTITFAAEHIEAVTEAVEAKREAFKLATIKELQRRVNLWVLLYNEVPDFLRPACLHFVNRYARRLNSVVCYYYPRHEGAPLPVEELFNV